MPAPPGPVTYSAPPTGWRGPLPHSPCWCLPVLGSSWPGPDPSGNLHGPESAARFPEQLPWECGSDWDSRRERGPLTITPPDSTQHQLCARLGGGMAGERGSQQHCCHLWAEAMGLLPASVSHRSLCPGRVWSPGPSAPPPAAGIASAQSWRDPGAEVWPGQVESASELGPSVGHSWSKLSPHGLGAPSRGTAEQRNPRLGGKPHPSWSLDLHLRKGDKCKRR